MSLEITYSSGKHKHRWRFSIHEVEILEILASMDLKDKIDDVLGVNNFGEERYVKREKLASSVCIIIDGIEKKSISLPFVFNVKAEIPRGSGNYSTGGTAICGLKMNGEEYVIEYGLNKCLLIKKWQDANMKIHHGEPVDIRHLNKVETDSDSFIGDIIIIKRSASKVLVKNLTKLKTFLEKRTSDNIIKVLG